MFSFAESSNDSSDGVPFLQEDVDDVNGEEPVCAGDEDLISWSDDCHDSQSLCGSGVENGRSRGLLSRPLPLIYPCSYSATILGLEP